MRLCLIKKTCSKGFSLVEMMVVVAILVIIAGIATPILLNDLPEMNLKSAARDIFSAMMRAKAEALRRGGYVTLLFNPGGNSYVLFYDNGDGGGIAHNGIIDGAEAVILTNTPLPKWVSFDPAAADTGGTGVSFLNNALIFSPQGIPVDTSGAAFAGGQTVGLRAVDRSGAVKQQRTITVSVAGGIKMQ